MKHVDFKINQTDLRIKVIFGSLLISLLALCISREQRLSSNSDTLAKEHALQARKMLKRELLYFIIVAIQMSNAEICLMKINNMI